jgi:hypothetical protein
VLLAIAETEPINTSCELYKAEPTANSVVNNVPTPVTVALLVEAVIVPVPGSLAATAEISTVEPDGIP